jgi:acetylornithine deacetylase
MSVDPISLTRELVLIPSPTGAEGPVAEYLGNVLEEQGYQVARQELEPGRFNLYATREAPVVVLATHLDVVPPDLPFREDAECLYGRGVCDAKGIAAAMVAAALRLAAQGERRVGLLFLVGEENGSDGARKAALLTPKGRYLINGEPTENRLSIGQKGSLRVELTATGKAAHSGYPDAGESALDALLETIARIRALPLPSDPVLGASTMNIGRIEGGVAPNVIAPSARAELLVRTVEDTAALQRALEAAAHPRVRVTFPFEIPRLVSPELPGWASTTVSYTSDLPILTGWGEGYQLGPGSILVAHTDTEQIRKRDLLDGVEQYVKLAGELLAREESR